MASEQMTTHAFPDTRNATSTQGMAEKSAPTSSHPHSFRASAILPTDPRLCATTDAVCARGGEQQALMGR
jgi:hypothetical protein